MFCAMNNSSQFVLALICLWATPCLAQTSDDPFAEPIPATTETITVGVEEFAILPDVDGVAARMMLLVDEPGTSRLFVNDMHGVLYSVSYDGTQVTPYLDLRSPQWNIQVEASRGERGFQSFAFHPQFARPGTPGFGKLFTYVDSTNTTPAADFVPGGGEDAQDTLLLEWTVPDPTASRYDGGAPREVLRVEQPFRNHNGGQIAFNPLAEPGDEEFGLLYIGSADGGSGGDPLNLSQDLSKVFGKILRIDPLGSDSQNGEYGIPSDNVFSADGNADTLGEIYAYGVRNPQRFSWDSHTGNFFLADIGQNIVEEVSLVTNGANLGWNVWEGSYRFISRRAVSLVDPRGETGFTYPVVEYGQPDPLLQPSSAATGLVVYRDDLIPQLANLVLFGDNPSGEVFFFDADTLPSGGQASIRRVLLRSGGETKTLLEMIQHANQVQGRDVAQRADLRFGSGPSGHVYLLNKRDGIIRRLTR